LPPPKTGQTINASFPPADNVGLPDQTAFGPLEIVRFAPEGEVALAPHLTITFSQPMIAVTSVMDLAASQVPVKLSPATPGKWRWLGTKTLIFEPEGRFPMATNYSVEIPAGTKSANGGVLATAKRWTFATPPVQMKSSYPNDGPHKRNPVLFAEFDQRIDAAAMLKSIRLTAGNASWRDRSRRCCTPFDEIRRKRSLAGISRRTDRRWNRRTTVARRNNVHRADSGRRAFCRRFAHDHRAAEIYLSHL
jgi:hypothetical protein